MTSLAVSRCSGSLAGWGSPPAGDVGQRAVSFARAALDELKAGLAARTSWVFNDLHALAQESGIDLAHSSSLMLAQRFLLALPGNLPPPELSFDSDGEVSFDWLGSDRRMLTVTLRADGRLSYASRLAPNDRDHGVKKFDDAIPKVLVELVQQVTCG